MRSLLTHLFAATLGMLAVVIWRAGTNDRDAATTDTKKSERSKGDVISSRPVAPPRDRSSVNRPSIEALISKPLMVADLESWLASKKGDAHSLGEAQVIAGLMTNNPDLIRQGIETDPGNSHLLFIGATLSAFSAEERIAMGKRLIETDPENGLAAFIHASNLMKGGQADAAIEMLRSATHRTRMDHFVNETQLLMDEAYGAAGFSPSTAKVRSLYDGRAAYLLDLMVFAKSLKGMGGAFTTSEASELQSLTASMGQRLADQSGSGSFALGALVGLSVEQTYLKGLPDDAPSPYEGLTVAQARESIIAERQKIREETENYPDVEKIFSDDPELMGRFVDRCRLTGELEAIKWLRGATARGK
jgi:hypothetical protein